MNVSGLIGGFRALSLRLPTGDSSRSPEAYVLAIDHKVAHLVEHFVYSRHAMYMRCYDNSIKAVCERLLAKLLWLLFRQRYDRAKRDNAARDALRHELQSLMMMADRQFLDYLWDLSAADPYNRSIVRNLISGPRFRRVHVVPMNAVGERMRRLIREPSGPADQADLLEELERLEDRIANRLGADGPNGWQIAIGVPSLDSSRPEVTGVRRDEDRNLYETLPSSLLGQLPLLAERPLAGKVEALLKELGQEAALEEGKKNEKVAALLRELQASPFEESMVNYRERVSLFVHANVRRRHDLKTLQRTFEDEVGRSG